jgi:hypothetical protein
VVFTQDFPHGHGIWYSLLPEKNGTLRSSDNRRFFCIFRVCVNLTLFMRSLLFLSVTVNLRPARPKEDLVHEPGPEILHFTDRKIVGMTSRLRHVSIVQLSNSTLKDKLPWHYFFCKKFLPTHTILTPWLM